VDPVLQGRSSFRTSACTEPGLSEVVKFRTCAALMHHRFEGRAKQGCSCSSLPFSLHYTQKHTRT
jgi:hypothetical protein